MREDAPPTTMIYNWMVMSKKNNEIDWILVQDAAKILCTRREIAGLCRVSARDLADQCDVVHGMPIDQYISRYAADGKRAVRAAQFDLVEKGSAQLLVHLGKTVLGQDGQTDLDTEVGLDMFDEMLSRAATAAFGDDLFCSRCKAVIDRKSPNKPVGGW